MAAGLLWVLDASINISMEPFRAFVADLLPPRSARAASPCRPFSSASVRVIASALPWLLSDVFASAGDGERASRSR